MPSSRPRESPQKFRALRMVCSWIRCRRLRTPSGTSSPLASADSPFRASFAPAYARPGYFQLTVPVAAPNSRSPIRSPARGVRTSCLCPIYRGKQGNTIREGGWMKRRNRPERARHTLGALGNKNVPQGGVEIRHNGGEDVRVGTTRGGGSRGSGRKGGRL